MIVGFVVRGEVIIFLRCLPVVELLYSSFQIFMSFGSMERFTFCVESVVSVGCLVVYFLASLSAASLPGMSE